MTLRQKLGWLAAATAVAVWLMALSLFLSLYA